MLTKLKQLATERECLGLSPSRVDRLLKEMVIHVSNRGRYTNWYETEFATVTGKMIVD